MIHPLPVIALAAKLTGVGLWLTQHPSAAVVAFFLPDPFLLHAMLVPSGQGFCRVFTRFVSDRPAVWLTIDDGPDEVDTPQLLDLLDRHGARATFFVIGERAARWPHLIDEIVRRGHEIGHHTHTHPAATFWCALPGRVQRELDQTLHVLSRTGVRPRWFRAPVGIKPFCLGAVLNRRGLHYVGWSIRSGDCHSRTAEQLVARIAPQLRPGAIILLHEGPSVPGPVRVRGVGLLLEEIARRNLACIIPDPAQLRSGAPRKAERGGVAGKFIPPLPDAGAAAGRS